MKYLFILSVLILLSVTPSMAKVIEEDPLEARTRDIAKTLRCAVCQSESIWESNSRLAKQMRQIIRERLVAGESPKEIKAYFLSRYGDYILLEPRKHGLNWVIWAGPFLILGLGGIVLYFSLSRWVRRTAKEKPEEVIPISEEERSRIDKEKSSEED